MDCFKVALLGAEGRMGQEIGRLIRLDDSLELDYAIDADVQLVAERFNACDVIVDFTIADALATNLDFLMASGISVPLVSGTTGLDERGRELLSAYQVKAPVIHATNMSLGVNLLFSLVDRYSPILKEHGFAPSMVETHHVHKKDSPSGTATTLFELMDEHYQQSTGFKKEDIVAHRIGEVVGEHSVCFSSAGEDITLSHSAKDRTIFAQGAVVAAKWIIGKSAGSYSMREVLGV